MDIANSSLVAVSKERLPGVYHYDCPKKGRYREAEFGRQPEEPEKNKRKIEKTTERGKEGEVVDCLLFNIL